MAGQLTIDTLKASSGVLATQNGMTGICKAWVNFAGGGSAATINQSFNISSVTRNGTGDYTITFTTAMPSANYVATGLSNNALNSGGLLGFPYTSSPTTTTARIYLANTIYATAADNAYVSMAFFCA